MNGGNFVSPVFSLLVVGLLVNSGLYFIFIFTAALVLHNHPALITVIIATGITYLSYALQIMFAQTTLMRNLSALLVAFSVAFGALAGLMLV